MQALLQLTLLRPLAPLRLMLLQQKVLLP
jgi:hypothetical protein